MDLTRISQDVIRQLSQVLRDEDLIQTWNIRQKKVSVEVPKPILPKSAFELASFIDHTLLKPETTKADIEKHCKEALEHKFKTVCVNSTWVKTCVHLLSGSNTLPISVVGFPLGAMEPTAKAFETHIAVQNGAREIDTVIAIGELKSGRHEAVLKDLTSVTLAAGPSVAVKVIIETSLLSQEEKRTACELALLAGADFVKTSTGFSGGGATVEDIELMTAAVSKRLFVKASGGIKSFAQAHALISAGAHRIGSSSGVQLLQGISVNGGY